MKAYIYPGFFKLVEKSGVGRAMIHQAEALRRAGVPLTAARKAKDYDVIHINTVFPDSYLAAKRARRQGKKVICYAHSTEEDFRNSFTGSNLLAPLFKLWIKKIYDCGDVIITPTPYSRELLSGYGLKKPVVSLTNGIDLEKVDPARCDGSRFRKKYGIPEDKKVVLGVGHWIARKGIEDFVEIARRLPQYEFYWFGYTYGPLVTPQVRAALECGFANVHFPGYIPRQEMQDAYAGSDVFLFPTHEETEGIVLLEAMALKTPVLVRDIPIYREWLPEGRVVYKARTTEQFVSTLRAMLEGELPDLTEAAARLVQENDIGGVGRQLKKIYESLAVK